MLNICCILLVVYIVELMMHGHTNIKFYLFIYLSIYLFTYLFIYLFIYIYSFTYLFIYIFIYLFLLSLSLILQNYLPKNNSIVIL